MLTCIAGTNSPPCGAYRLDRGGSEGERDPSSNLGDPDHQAPSTTQVTNDASDPKERAFQHNYFVVNGVVKALINGFGLDPGSLNRVAKRSDDGVGKDRGFSILSDDGQHSWCAQNPVPINTCRTSE